MKYKYLGLIIMILSLATNHCFAAKATKTTTINTPEKADTKPPKAFPTGCKQIGYEFYNGILVLTPVHKNTEQKQVIYFIQNISDHEIYFANLQNMNNPYILENDNTLNATQWAVYASDQVTKFICSKNEKIKTAQSILDCAHSVKICEYANVKFAPNNRGNYWATTNMEMRQAVSEIVHQGILLKS